MYKVVYALLLAIMLPNAVTAQRNEIYNDRIATLKVVAGTNWQLPPVIRLNSTSEADHINISFDDLTHTYQRYTYKIEHCEADWTVSDELFASDYVDGFGRVTEHQCFIQSLLDYHTQQILQVETKRQLQSDSI